MNYHSGLLTKIALASTLVLTSADKLNYSFSQEPAKPKVSQGIESKFDTEKDLDLLNYPYRLITEEDEIERAKYNKIASEIITTLKENKRFDSEYNNILKSYFNPCSFDKTKNMTEYARKFLLREKDPDAYIKEFYKDSEVIEKIKNINEKDYDEFKFNVPWKVDPKNLTLTDKIFIYETKELLKNPKANSPTNISPISGNPIVR